MTFGITPTEQHTGFGYIEESENYGVARFVEKPNEAAARGLPLA